MSKFLLRTPDEWTPRNATYPATTSSPVEPTLDWFVDYERPPANAPERVRLSGHRVGIEGLSTSLHGISFTAVDIRGGKGLAGRSADPIGPSVVLVPLNDDYTAMALSYELSVPDLVAWASTLISGTAQQWAAANGARLER